MSLTPSCWILFVEFRRNFTPVEHFGVGFSIIGLVFAGLRIAALDSWKLFKESSFNRSILVYSVPYGGPVAMIWGVRSPPSLSRFPSINSSYFQWAVCGVFLTTIALAMAELGSAAPTSGGLYYWTFKFSSPRWRCLLSWIVGCKWSRTVLARHLTNHPLLRCQYCRQRSQRGLG